MKKQYVYVHTISGRLGTYDGNQICYSTVTRPATTCDTLAQIKKERRDTIAWRKKQGFYERTDFAHRRIALKGVRNGK